MSNNNAGAGASLVLAGVLAMLAAGNVATASEATQASLAQPGALHDFDFLAGTWRVHNRRLKQILKNSDEWTRFDGRLVGRPLMEGRANYDELWSDQDGLLGMSFRSYNLKTGQWSDYWVAQRDGVLQPPVFGSFQGATGVFEGDDVHEGQPIRVRYTWSGVDTPTPRWQQAYSADGGHSWETNWVMDFERIESATPN